MIQLEVDRHLHDLPAGLYGRCGIFCVIETQDHAELMTGVKATWYEVRRNIDRLPDFVNPEKPPADFSDPIRARLARWLEEKLKDRLEG